MLGVDMGVGEGGLEFAHFQPVGGVGFQVGELQRGGAEERNLPDIRWSVIPGFHMHQLDQGPALTLTVGVTQQDAGPGSFGTQILAGDFAGFSIGAAPPSPADVGEDRTVRSTGVAVRGGGIKSCLAARGENRADRIHN